MPMSGRTAIPLQAPVEGIRRALVLAGGGARGAYEAGVLRYLYGDLARRLGFGPRIDIYSGSSVGAVHSCHLAARAHEPLAGARALSDIWSQMSFSAVYRFGMGDAASCMRTLFGSLVGRSNDTGHAPRRLHGLLNTEPLEALVVHQIPWRQLRRNLRGGLLDALCISATDVATGRIVSFIDGADLQLQAWAKDPTNVPLPTRVGPDHALASAAIPMLFPAIRIGGTYYVDGGLRHSSPLTPALRLGANRLLIVGLHGTAASRTDDPVSAERLEKFRTLGFVIGKVLNALLGDRLDADIRNMHALNTVLRAGIERYGAEHVQTIMPTVEHARGRAFQVVEDVLISPSEDIGQIASRHVRRLQREGRGSLFGRFVFRALTRGEPEDEADLMSYLLFDGSYASDLMELGAADAAAREEQLAQLFLE
jgi:NTE family protein